MLRNLSKVSLGGLALITTMLFSSWASAAPTPTKELTVPIGGFVSQSGAINDSEDDLDTTTDWYSFVVNPDQDTTVLALTWEDFTNITSFSIWSNGGSGAVFSQVGASGTPGDTLILAYDSSTDYQIRLTGGNQYTFTLSAVPLPAAAWLFMSMIGGGAWLKRRRRKA